jgi:uncharacterized protein YqjF (DUF2071 family)
VSFRQDLEDAIRQPRVLPEREHRPWPLPRLPWVMGQTWHRLLFAHWPVDPELVRPKVHPSIPLDTWDGQAWLTLTPFSVRGLRPRFLPPLPGISSFPELNLRTYATVDGKPGIYFFSLDADDWAAVIAARRTYRVPYFKADMDARADGDETVFRSDRTHGPPAEFEATYGPTGPVANAVPGTLDYWLCERYCLYTTDRRGRVLRGDVHHPPWPLQPARLEVVRNTMARHIGIELDDDPALLHLAHRQDVVFWPLVPA